jgi:TcpE family
MPERLIVRSYRRVFEVDRRIYRVDRWALPVPGGVPLRGVGYFALALVAVVAAGVLPGLGGVVGALSAPLRYVVVPVAVAVLGTQAAPDGRVAHRFAWEWLCLRVRSRRRSAGRAVPLEGEPVAWRGVVATCWDEHAAELRRGRIRGPVRVTFFEPVRLVGRRRGRLVARAPPGDGGTGDTVVVVGAEQVLEVRR